MLARIIKDLPNTRIEQAKANGTVSLAKLLNVVDGAMVWTEPTAGPVLDFVYEEDRGDEATNAQIVTWIENRIGPCHAIAVRRNGVMEWAKEPPVGWVMKHEYAGLEVVVAP